MTDRTPTSQEPMTAEGARQAMAREAEAAFTEAVNRRSRTAVGGLAVPHFADVERIWAAMLPFVDGSRLTDLGYSVVPTNWTDGAAAVTPDPVRLAAKHLLEAWPNLMHHPSANPSEIAALRAALRSSDDSTPDGAR